MKKALLFLVVAVSFCFAQENSAPKMNGAEKGGRSPGASDIQMMEEMGLFDDMDKGGGQEKTKQMQPRENMEAMILARVKTELELTPEQAGKFVENFYKGEEIKKEYQKKKMEAGLEIKKALEAEKLDEGVLNSLVEAYNRSEREMNEKVQEMKNKNLSMLNSKQKAKMVLMEIGMQRMMMQGAKKGMEKGMENRQEMKGDRKDNKKMDNK